MLEKVNVIAEFLLKFCFENNKDLYSHFCHVILAKPLNYLLSGQGQKVWQL